MNKTFCEASLSQISHPDYDFKLPKALKGMFTKYEWFDTVYCLVLDSVAGQIEKLKDGVVEYKNVFTGYDPDSERYEMITEVDPLPRKLDLVKVALNRNEFPDWKSWIRTATLELHKQDRATPLFNYLLTDYDMALDHIRLGVVDFGNPDSRYIRRTEGFWEDPFNFYLDLWIRRRIFHDLDTFPYICLEGSREFVVCHEMLQAWGVSEDKFFADVIKRSCKRLAEETYLTKCGVDYHGTDKETVIWHIDCDQPEVFTLMAGLEHWMAYAVGERGALIFFHSDTYAYAVPLENADDLIDAISDIRMVIIDDMNPYYLKGCLFRDQIYWYYQGKIYPLDLSDNPDETASYDFIFNSKPPELERCFVMEGIYSKRQ